MCNIQEMSQRIAINIELINSKGFREKCFRGYTESTNWSTQAIHNNSKVSARTEPSIDTWNKQIILDKLIIN